MIHLKTLLFIAFLLGFVLATLLMIHFVNREAGEIQATGEEWERVSRGYVEETKVNESTCYFNQEIYIDGEAGSHWLCE
jgi:hypothetical protein